MLRVLEKEPETNSLCASGRLCEFQQGVLQAVAIIYGSLHNCDVVCCLQRLDESLWTKARLSDFILKVDIEGFRTVLKSVALCVLFKCLLYVIS